MPNAFESTVSSAQPVELYKFEYGLAAFRYTSFDVDSTFDGELFVREAISRSQVEQSQESNAANLTITVPVDNPVARLFVSYLPAVPVRAVVIRHQDGDQSQSATIFAGTVSAARFTDDTCELTCEPTSAALNRPIPANIFQAQCNKTLFSTSNTYAIEGSPKAQSAGCNASRAAFQFVGVVTAVAGRQVDIATLTGAQGYWTGGYIERASGEVRWITGQPSATALTLVHPIADLAIGEQVTVYPGCDGSEDTCRNKFNNTVNFGGFFRLPSKNPFDQSVI